MKKALLVMAMVIALAMSTMAGAVAKNGNAPGHAGDTGTVQGEAADANAPGLGTIKYLFNKAGYHFWFTATADVGAYYEAGNSYHNVYKYVVDDPENWCAEVNIPPRPPYNAGGTDGGTAFYKIWNVTTETWTCGSEG